MQTGRLVFAAVLFGFVLMIIVVSREYHPVARQFPQMVAWLILILLGWELVKGIRTRRKGTPEKTERIKRLPRPILIKRWLVIGVGLAAYVLLLPWLGYVAMTSVLMLTLLWFFDIRRPLTLLLYTGVTVGVIYFVFVKLLFVPLPAGAWWSLWR